jgi:hypothetical protein
MSTRPPDSTHEAEHHQPLPPDDPRANVQSPSADRMQGANSPPQPQAATAQPRRSSPENQQAKAGSIPPEADDNESATADQDIDTAGTDADDQSPTRAMGTGLAPDRKKG